MHNYAFSCNKIFIFFAKMDEFLSNHPNFSKFSAPVAPKMGHFSQFFDAFGAEKLVTLGPKLATLLAIGSLQFDPWFLTTFRPGIFRGVRAPL